MCEGKQHENDCDVTELLHSNASAVLRRDVLRAGLLFPVAVWLGNHRRVRNAVRTSTPAINVSGETARLMAIHLHGSFSEGAGSWDAQFAQAALNNLDVIVPTDHDWRARLMNFREAYHFTGMSETGPDGTWQLVTTLGAGLATGSGATISSLRSPADPAGGSIGLSAKATGTAAATVSVLVDDGPARKNYHGTLLGRSLGLSVYPVRSTRAAAIALRLTYSIHPSISAKRLQVVYRFCTDVTETTYSANGAVGTVIRRVPGNTWSALTFDLQADLQHLWPGVVAADNAITKIELLATARRSYESAGNFAALTLNRASGYDALAAQDSVIGAYRARYPALLAIMGSEDSLDQHFCRIGGAPFVYPYPGTTTIKPKFGDDVAADQVAQIQAQGGVASLNHPYSVEGGVVAMLSQNEQDAKQAAVAQNLLRVRAFGADVLEVGYTAGGGVDLLHHQQLWDTLSRNGIYLTADGVSDDHNGVNWGSLQNRFLTCPWTSGLDESSLLTALRNGRAYVALLGDFAGAGRGASSGIDLDMEGVRMGEVSQRTDAGLVTRALRIDAPGLPAGSEVVLIQGPVDYAGQSVPSPGTTRGPSLPASAFSGGSQEFTVDVSHSTFIRVDVVDSAGKTIAFSNPVWQLREAPPNSAPIPANRLSPF